MAKKQTGTWILVIVLAPDGHESPESSETFTLNYRGTTMEYATARIKELMQACELSDNARVLSVHMEHVPFVEKRKEAANE